jgi:hypothetical protein
LSRAFVLDLHVTDTLRFSTEAHFARRPLPQCVLAPPSVALVGKSRPLPDVGKDLAEFTVEKTRLRSAQRTRRNREDPPWKNA